MRLGSLKNGIFDTPSVMFLFLNRIGNVSLINRKGCEILGYSQKEILGLNWFDNFIREDMRKEIKNVFFQLISEKTELVEYYENLILTKGGEEKIISFHNVIVYDNNDKIAGIFSAGNDITEQHLAIESLKETKRILSGIIECAQDGILIADIESNKLNFLNKKICTMLGYPEAELLRLSIFDIHPEDSHEYVFKQFSLLAQNKIDLAKDIPVKRRDGSIFYTTVSATDLAINGKKCLLGVLRDTAGKIEQNQKGC